MKESNPGSRHKEMKTVARGQCKEGKAARLVSTCPVFLQGCHEGPACEHLVNCY